MGLKVFFLMKVEKVLEDVWKFKGSSSVYLIKNADEWVLIDAGDACEKKELASEISKIVDLDKIGIVLLTHLHYDHVGSLGLFSNAKVFANRTELQDYAENARGFYFYVDKEVDLILREKAKALKGAGWGLKILKVPGHTRGSVVFLDEKRKLLFSGDTIFAGEIEGRIDLPNSVPGEMRKSVSFLRKLVFENDLTLCPGHGY